MHSFLYCVCVHVYTCTYMSHDVRVEEVGQEFEELSCSFPHVGSVIELSFVGLVPLAFTYWVT